MPAPALPASPALNALLDRLRELGVADGLDAELGAITGELAASDAQLEAANEELAAAAKQLETTGEELRRAADELAAVDEERRNRSEDCERIARALQTAIDGQGSAVVVLDGDQKVRAWSAGAARRWGHDRDAVLGRAIGRLELDGQAAGLAALVRSVLAGGAADGDDGGPQHDAELGACCRPVPGPSGTEGAVLVVDV